MGSFTDAAKTALNFLGGGFPPSADFKLGDTLEAMGAPDPTTQSATNRTIHVQTPANGGSDATGDGLTVATAYATPQKAFDSLARLATPGFFQIQCGAGNFPLPVLDKALPPGVYYSFVGNRDTPAGETIDFGANPSFALVGAQAVRQRANIGAYGFSVDNTTHWLELSFGANFPTWGAAVAPSTTPNLDIPGPRFGLGTAIALRPFETVFEGSGIGGAGPPVPTVGLLNFVGIRIESLASNFVFQNMGFLGCDLPAATYADCSVESSVTGNALLKGVEAVGCVWDGFVSFHRGFSVSNLLASTICLANAAPAFRNADVALGYGPVTGALDLEGAGGSINCTENSSATASRDCWVDSARSKFLSVSRCSVFEFVGPTVTGVTTASCVSVAWGSHIIGCESACNGTLTSSGGSEILVGGNAGATFASLPASDVGAAVPTLCTAT